MYGRFEYGVKISDIETRKIDRGIAVYCIGTEFGSYLLMGDELRSATDTDRLLVSSGLSTRIFP